MPSQTTLFYRETLDFYHEALAHSATNDEAVLRTVLYVLMDRFVFGSDFDEEAAKEALVMLNESVA